MAPHGGRGWSGQGGSLACGGAHVPDHGGSVALAGLCGRARGHVSPGATGAPEAVELWAPGIVPRCPHRA